ncbi:MAG: sigma-70 family RNA polymerase sigma factor [Planctomycetes bacterium]|nr:sigma-70 family RNA polymerase sigma factor [Planctomycetota bacterium]
MSEEAAGDEHLMSRVAAGDMGALGELVRRHQGAVGSFAFRMLGRRDAADDVVQEAFLHVHRAARRYRPEAKFTTWLYSIVVNLCRDVARRAQRAPVQLDDEPGPSTASATDPLVARERAERVRRALGALPERQRTAILLHRYQELSHREIAQATGWSESAVESLIVRAYATLRQELADLKE